MENSFRLAMCQMKVTDEKNENINKALYMVEEAAKNDSLIAVLPEMFNCPYDSSKFAAYAEEAAQSVTLGSLAEAAEKWRIYVVAGSIPEKYCGRIYNSSFVLSPEGKIVARHRKMHLFDIDVPGRITFKESDSLDKGSEVTVFDTPFCRVGAAVCYDMRFPELVRLMALKGAKLVIVPAAFSMTTGPAHWELLIRTRALDNQVYFTAVSPARNHEASYTAYGHSMTADPWGTVTAAAGEGEEIVYSDIDLSAVERIRNELPLLAHRRADVYELKQLEKSTGGSYGF